MTVLFAGGDKRTLAALHYMQFHGYHTITYALTDRIDVDGSKAEAVVLPFPCIKQGKLNAPLIKNPPTLEELLYETGIDPKRVRAIGGPLPNSPFKEYVDLSLREDLKLRNAVTTAEGALALLIENTDRAVLGMKCLILGYGAIGKRLSEILCKLGASVTVAARKHKDRTDALCHGYHTQDTADLSLRGFDAVFNTVPSRLLTEDILYSAENDVRIFELASAPGGCDPEIAKRLNKLLICGPALPGKVAPVTAGEDLAKTVIHILSSP